MTRCLLIVLLLFVVAAVAETPPAPQYWVAAGAGLNYLAPQACGWMSFGARIVDGTYSYTSVDMTDKNASMRTGILRLLVQQGRFALLAIADAGVASGGGDSAAAISGGGVLTYDISRWVRVSGVHAVASVRVLKTGLNDVQPVFGFGLGKAF